MSLFKLLVTIIHPATTVRAPPTGFRGGDGRTLSLQLPRREYRYNEKDWLTHFVYKEGAITRLLYYKNDRIRKVVRPEQYEEQKDDGIGMNYTYNCHDQVLAITDADGIPLGNVYLLRSRCSFLIFGLFLLLTIVKEAFFFQKWRHFVLV